GAGSEDRADVHFRLGKDDDGAVSGGEQEQDAVVELEREDAKVPCSCQQALGGDAQCGETIGGEPLASDLRDLEAVDHDDLSDRLQLGERADHVIDHGRRDDEAGGPEYLATAGGGDLCRYGLG